jgi:integrase
MFRHIQQVQDMTGKDPDEFMAYAESMKSIQIQDQLEKMAEGMKPGARIGFIADVRSFLHHNGFNSLPKANLTYILQDWHRAYKKEEIKNLLSYLDQPFQKLFVYMALESGLRAQKVIDIKYGHIKEDLEAGLSETAIRFGPEEYQKKKSSGFTFLGTRSVELIRKLIADKQIKTKDDSRIIPFSYMAAYLALKIAARKAGLDKKIQLNHGLRKYFENALDKADLDEDQKKVLEGHFAGTRAHHYTEREWDGLRPLYRKAYPHIDVETGSAETATKLQTQAEEIKDLKKEVGELKTMLYDLIEKRKKSGK